MRKKLKSTETLIENEEVARKKFVDTLRKKILASNVTIPLLQRELAEQSAKTQSKKRELLNIENMKQEKR